MSMISVVNCSSISPTDCCLGNTPRDLGSGRPVSYHLRNWCLSMALAHRSPALVLALAHLPLRTAELRVWPRHKDCLLMTCRRTITPSSSIAPRMRRGARARSGADNRCASALEGASCEDDMRLLYERGREPFLISLSSDLVFGRQEIG